MASKEECDRYAAQLAQRFEEYTKWAIANWPNKDFPLLASDFDRSREELSDILGPKLAAGETRRPDQDGDAGGGQYRDVAPMPWP
ncbi:hypothetical protein [Noviherbaspirillum aridicola]|uniref:Uncharacterized protein n=1 Tax=Noviherbaspirillum aridicola TaxID=2849687 RepID=A0ABQ4Q8E5_9BURK|nr:hypothetical protein [Noviherbaspirillum aridicola]GIZ53182.1 hypothetical protein NCCP691_31960 [Noviherbaspirillum aridicola]